MPSRSEPDNTNTVSEKQLYGWVENLSNDDYHAGPGVSASNLKAILRSPAHYRYGDAGLSKETARMGNLIHTALLEPEKIDNAVELPTVDYRSAENKQIWWEFVFSLYGRGLASCPPSKPHKRELLNCINQDVIFLNDDSRELISGVKKRMDESDVLTDLLSGVHEVSGFLPLDGEYDGVLAKIRPDVRCPEQNRIVDIKTTMDARSFPGRIYDLGYHIQMAWYLDSANQIDIDVTDYYDFFWLAIEKEPPYGIIAYQAGNDIYEKGREDIAIALCDYRDCVADDRWPCYDDKIRPINLPGWVK